MKRSSWLLPLALLFLGACSSSKSVIFVVDTSGSMKRDRLIDDVKSSIRKILLQYGEGDHVHLLTFDGEAREVLSKTLQSKDDTAEIFDAVDAIQAEGKWTDLVGALDASLKRTMELKDVTPGRTTLVLYTDGKHDPAPESAHREVQSFADLVKTYYKGYRPGDSWFIFYVELDQPEPALRKFLEETGSGTVVGRADFAKGIDFTLEPRGIAGFVIGGAVLALLLAFFFLWFLPWLRNVSLVPISGGTVSRAGAIPLDGFSKGALARFLGFGKSSDIHLSFGQSKVDVSVDSKGRYFVKPVSGQVVRVDGKVVVDKFAVRPGQKIQIGTSEYVLERSARKRK